MNDYKRDFENAIEMIDWQNTMLRQQADRIVELEKEKEKLKSQIPDWENIRKPNPFVGKTDSNPTPYKIGDIDWTKALK